MTLELPNLDDRTFEDLLRELLELIPTYAPEWTDYNDSDPGITLLQLWTHLVEVMLNRLNQLPERAHLSLLNLVGVERRPGFPARAHVTFDTIPSAPQAAIPARTVLQADPRDGGPPLVFETTDAIDPIMRPLAVVQRIPLVGNPENLTDSNAPGGPEFRPFGTLPQVDDAVYFGFEGTSAGDIFSFPPRVVMRFFEREGGRNPTGVEPDELFGPAPVDLIWEYRPGPNTDEWHPLETISDGTNGLLRPGYIELAGPANVGAVEKLGVAKPPHHWLRCRFGGGAFPHAHYPRYDFVRFNTVEAEQLESIDGQIVAISDGRPGFSADLVNSPVDATSLVLETESVDGQSESWEIANNLSAAGRHDRKFMLDPLRGRITFGDGRRGRIPVAGATVIARSYRWGGGAHGNVPADAIQDIPASIPGVSSVTNPQRATGGADPESTEDVKARAAGEIRSGGALVTAHDFETFVQGIGGVARAAAFPGMQPNWPGQSAPGSATVVVVPEPDGEQPQPSNALLSLVRDELDKRRLITAHIHVTGPAYRTLDVTARVHAVENASFAAVAQAVEKELHAHLAPVRESPGAQQSWDGWPFGQDLVPTSLYGVIEAAAGVAAVPMLELRVDGRPHPDLRDPVILSRYQLFSLGRPSITVVETTDAELRDALP